MEKEIVYLKQSFSAHNNYIGPKYNYPKNETFKIKFAVPDDSDKKIIFLVP